MSDRTNLRPYRLLLITDAPWSDPSSQFLDAGNLSAEVLCLCGMLRVWGVPFDILRLDQQLLEINYLLDGMGQPLYGGIIFLAKKPIAGGLLADGTPVLRHAVEKLGMGLLALGGAINDPVVQEILGISAAGVCTTTLRPWQGAFTFTAEHPLTHGLVGQIAPPRENWTGGYWPIHRVGSRGALVLARHDQYDAATARLIRPGVWALWMGGDWKLWPIVAYPQAALLIRRAITLLLGYSLTCDFDDAALLTMDDPGCNHLMYGWHCPTMSAEMIRRDVIAPLREHGATLTVFAIPGFLDVEQRMIVPTWQQQFTDAYGLEQDLVSTKRGLDEAIAAGVLEVQVHGWSHMQPDLLSPPGPWYDQPLDGYGSCPDWYFEFWDRARQRDIPATVQRFRLLRAREALQSQFGPLPLVFRPGGAKYSVGLGQNTLLIAAGCGFACALRGDDFLALDGDRATEIRVGGPFIATCHDIDLYHRPDTIARMVGKARQQRGDQVRFIGADELVSYLRTQVRRDHGAAATLIVEQPQPFCRHAGAHGARWTLMTAPDLGALAVTVAGKRQTLTAMTPLPLNLSGDERQTVELELHS